MAGSESVRLTNADFRKFVSTTGTLNRPSKTTTNAKVKQNYSSGTPRALQKGKAAVKNSTKQDDELSLANIMQKYRDRAKERRVATNGGPSQADGFLTDVAAGLTAAPAANTNNKFPPVYNNVGDQKRRDVEESKYLGGDMEHTHLVRGLDYALLQKVRADLEQQGGEKHADDDESREKTNHESGTDAVPAFSSRIARDIYDLHFNFDYSERNELFMPGRMCFEYDLQDPEFVGTPTVLVRSKAELKLDETKTVSTTDLVIDKLTEIFAYMRKGLRATKQTKRQRVEDQWTAKTAPPRPVDPRDAAYKDANIFDDDDDEDDNTGQRVLNSDRKRDGSVFREGDNRKDHSDHENSHRTGSYFRKPAAADSNDDRNAGSRSRLAVDDDDPDERKARLLEMNRELARLRSDDDSSDATLARNRNKRKGIANQTEDSYAECYPDYDVSATANDSDEEDMPGGQQPLNKTDGSKKSQLSRWDFDSQEKYSEYMSQLEATPQAAFQFGQKMNDGRKSRKVAAAAKGDASNDKAKYDQQWTKIQKIIDTKKDSAKKSKAE